MAVRTTGIFAVLGNERRFHVLWHLLENGAQRPGEVAQALQLPKPAVSQILRVLAGEGLVAAQGGQRTAYGVLRPRETRWLIRAAALIAYEHHRSQDLLALAQRLTADDMSRGANEPSPGITLAG